jgi:hypothetical protein
MISRYFALVFAALVHHSVASSAIIDGFDPARHERFLSDETINPGFLINESQLSGVAIQRAILITPRHYVAAAHVSTDQATFRGSDGVRRTYQSVSSQRLLTKIPGEGSVGSDIELHTLATAVDASIQPVPIVVGDFRALLGRTLFAMDLQSRAGRNTIDAIGVVEFRTGSSDSIAIQFSYDTDSNGGTGGMGMDEIGLLSGDSGNAALIEIDGQIGLLGTHMGIDVPTGSSAVAGDQYDSFSTLVGAYEDQLNSIVTADGYSLRTITVAAIPEPSSAIPLAMLLIGGCVRRPTRERIIL